MRYKALVLVLALLLPAVVFPQAGKKSAADPPDKALMQQICDAWATLKPENVARYYDKSPTAVFYDLAPLKYTGWSEYENGARSLSATLESLKFTVNDDVIVHQAGEFAWGTATVRTEIVEKNGRRQVLDGRWTAIWERKGSNWLIVHDHFSAPLPVPYPLFVGPGGATAKSPMKPWRGTWSGDFTIVGKCEDEKLSIVESGTGYMEHMGKTAWSNKYCMDQATWTASGNAVETAANGDEIHLRTSLQVIWTSPSGGDWVETETVVGGTGRFAAATGVSHSSGTFTFTSPTMAVWDGTTTGTLSY